MSNYITLDENSQQGIQSEQTIPRVHYTTQHALQTQMLMNALPDLHSRHERPTYKSKLAFKLAVVQIINGVVAVLCGLVILIMKTFLYFTGIGLGAGSVFIAGGVFGVLSARHRAVWAILTCMILSIVAAIASGVTIIASSEGIDVNNRGHPFYEINDQRFLKTGTAMDAILIVVSVVEMSVAIVQATLCCRVTCCAAGPQRPEIMVVYLPQPTQNPPPDGVHVGLPTTVLVQPDIHY